MPQNKDIRVQQSVIGANRIVVRLGPVHISLSFVLVHIVTFDQPLEAPMRCTGHRPAPATENADVEKSVPGEHPTTRPTKPRAAGGLPNIDQLTTARFRRLTGRAGERTRRP